jgi:hypothetical protein
MPENVHVPPPAASDTTFVGEDQKAQREAVALANDDLEEEAARREFKRNEAFKNSLSMGLQVIFWICLIFLVVAGVIWWHLVTPPQWHFLSDAQIDHIQSLLLGGATSGIASGYVKRRVS